MTASAMPAGEPRLPAGGEVGLLTAAAEARLFLRLRTTIAWETLRWMLTHARLRLVLLVLLSAVFWGSLYALFAEAFRFLDALHADVISLLFNAFFSSLMAMLAVSAGILAYGGLFCSTEARLLLTLPVRPETILRHKFQEALWFSCWGFVLLGSPMLVAYGVVRGSGWPYFMLLLPFMVSFAVIPTTLGAMCCLVLVAWIPRLRIHALALAVAAGSLAVIWLGWSIVRAPRPPDLSAEWLSRAFGRLAVTEQKLLPSWWLSSGLIESARSGHQPGEDPGEGVAALSEAVKFLAVLVANAMLLQLLAAWLARVLYRRGYSQLCGEVPSRRRRSGGWLDELLANAGSRAGRPLRLLLVKDIQVFRRDVSQWSQFVIFFGLLGLYFLNLRSFEYHAAYASMIGFLNLAVVGLILSTFTTRFVYPMISLEGRRFWILGLLPVHRDQIVWSKFLFSFLGALVPCCGLVLLSDGMLGLDRWLIVLHEVCCVVLCMGLSGIAVGLGAWMPELRETSPAKISSGFGGTLSLVVSSLFIMLVVFISALPTQLSLIATAIGTGRAGSPGFLAWASSPGAQAASLTAVVTLGILATGVPLVLGLRAFRRLEP